MIKMLANQLLTYKAMAKAAKKLADRLNEHKLQEGELMPLMVIRPNDGKLTMDVIVMKMEDNKMVYSRQIDSKELTADYLVSSLSGIEI